MCETSTATGTVSGGEMTWPVCPVEFHPQHIGALLASSAQA
jgi:hypothetical protein